MTPDLVPAVVWVNGEQQRPESVHLSAHDRGFTLADAVFETMRVSGGVVFRLDRHLARLRHALATLDIPEPRELRSWVLDAVGAIRVAERSIRLTVTRGIGGPGVAPPTGARPTVIVAVNPLPEWPSAIYEVGLTAHVPSGRRNEHAMTAGLKTVAYTDAVAALLEARRAGADEALFLDTEGHCSEATSSNLFISTGTTLMTPPVSCGALPGITRAAVLELADGFGIPTAECPFGLEELAAADEAFLTSSLRGIAPLVRVGARAIGPGTPGPYARRFIAAYSALVAQECGGTRPRTGS